MCFIWIVQKKIEVVGGKGASEKKKIKLQVPKPLQTFRGQIKCQVKRQSSGVFTVWL